MSETSACAGCGVPAAQRFCEACDEMLCPPNANRLVLSEAVLEKAHEATERLSEAGCWLFTTVWGELRAAFPKVDPNALTRAATMARLRVWNRKRGAAK